MSTPVFHRRRIERFAQLLEAEGGCHHHAHRADDEELTKLVALGRRVAAVPPPGKIDPGFRADLRAMLMAAAAREGIGATADRTAATGAQPTPRQLTSRRLRTRGIIVLGVAVGAITVSGISAGSEDALPGDAFYVVKRQTERAQLALASDAERARLHLEFAGTRLFEARAMQDDPQTVAALLDDMDAQTREAVRLLSALALHGGDAALLDPLTTFVANQRQQLTTMLSDTQNDRVSTSLALLDLVDARVDAVRAALACGAVPSEEADMLGPVPTDC
jgi:hypothetical protein